MNWGSRSIGLSLAGLCGLVLLTAPGCMTAGNKALLRNEGSPSAEISDASARPTTVRSQRPEGGVSLRQPMGVPAPAGLPTPPDNNIERTSLSNSGSGGKRINIRAWINGSPVFEDEIVHLSGDKLRFVVRLPEPTRSEKSAEILNGALDQTIDEELLFQDASKKLEKVPKAMDQLRDYVNQEVERQYAGMRKSGVPEEAITQIDPIHRRVMERKLISQEYVRQRIRDYIKSNSRLEEVREYYEAHRNEFQTVDKVKWQHVFISVERHKTPADARKYAEQLLASCQQPEDFSRVLPYDDGVSKDNGGEGYGQRRGEIRPPELEEILFSLREGEIGPIVPCQTGFHLVRVVKRDNAGLLPLDDHTQKTIRRKLENQLAEREFRRVVREIRTRAVVQKEGF